MTEPAPAPTAAPEPTALAAPAASATDPLAEIARLQAEVDTWKGHSRTWETRAKTNGEAAQAAAVREATLAKVAEALGLDAGNKSDPEAIAKQLAATQAEARARSVELAVLRAAQAAGADGDALLDSRGFLKKVADVDPADGDAVKAAVAAAVAANPKFAVAAPAAPTAPAPAPAARQASTAGSFDQQPGTPRQLGAEDMKHMTAAQISEASRKGLFRDYLNSPN
jgi:hypothetical protein